MEKIIKAFRKQKNELAVISSSLVDIIQKKTGLTLCQRPNSQGCIEYTIGSVGSYWVVLQIYYGGTILLYKQEPIPREERKAGRVYYDLSDEIPKIFELTSNTKIDKMILEIKKFIMQE